MKPNTQFNLDVNDIDMIESALRLKLAKLSSMRLTHVESTIVPADNLDRVKELDQEIMQVNSLLGKIHDQKVWYRPNSTYISG